MSDKQQLLIINKNFSNFEENGLKCPSQLFIEIINCALNIFEVKFLKVRHKKNLKLIYMVWFKKRNLIKNWLCENDE